MVQEVEKVTWKIDVAFTYFHYSENTCKNLMFKMFQKAFIATVKYVIFLIPLIHEFANFCEFTKIY